MSPPLQMNGRVIPCSARPMISVIVISDGALTVAEFSPGNRCWPQSLKRNDLLPDGDLAVHQHGEEPVAEFGEVLVLLLECEDLRESGICLFVIRFQDIR